MFDRRPPEGERTPAASQPVSTIMQTAILKVSSDCAASSLLSIFDAYSATRAVVVDEDGSPIGIVRRESLPADAETAEDAMGPVAFTLNESIPISVAAALMASAGVGEVPIVSASLGTVGMVTAFDMMTWIGRQAGHRVVGPRSITFFKEHS